MAMAGLGARKAVARGPDDNLTQPSPCGRASCSLPAGHVRSIAVARTVLAKSYARIHWQNLANFGILALEFTEPADYDQVRQGDTLILDHVRDDLAAGNKLMATNQRDGSTYELRHRLSARQVNMVLEGGQIPLLKRGPPSPVAAATG